MRVLTSIALTLLFTFTAAAQDVRVIANDNWCDEDGWGNNDGERVCEVREISLPANRETIEVNGGQNGGIQIRGWDRNEILVRAKVTGNARTEAQAREIVDAVSIETGRVIEADIPRPRSNWRNNTWASVSFEVLVPYRSNVSLETHNGGVRVEDVAGDVAFDVLNGGVSLINLAGFVEGKTTNGGIDIVLTGDEWAGEGLDVVTTNGGVEIEVPQNYSARLETSTVNGRVRFDFPITVQGRLDREISTTLGDGGKTIRARTTNGGVRVKRG